MLLKEYGKAKARIASALGLEPVHNSHPETNGEYRFLELIGSLPEIANSDSAIDVGANKGEWTGAAIERLSAGGIKKFYCVEPIPTFANEIHTRFNARGDVTLIERILSHTAGGTAEIFEVGGGGRLYRDYRGRSAGDAPNSGKKVVSHQVPISTGDEVFGALDARPYLVKIDCDGHDLHVLRGFERTLRKKRPLVQFEYSDFWIGAGSRLRDACALLKSAGYNTYKVFPDRLVQFKFNALHETFRYKNVVGVPQEFASLSGRDIAFAAG